MKIAQVLAAALLLAGPGLAASPAGDHGQAHVHDRADPHLRMTTARAATPADRERLDRLVREVRTGLARYRDVQVAVADGYEPFLPDQPLPVHHYSRRSHGLAAIFAFDPLKPTSLLYRSEPDGRSTLVGVMYTAPASFSEQELDARVPLSLLPWHQHVNLCVPGPLHRERWTETRDGRPLFGPKSPVATEADCDAVDGVFRPRLFGWMVHVDL